MFPSKKTTWLNPSTWRGEADQGTQKSKSSDLLISDLRWCWNPSRCRSPKKKTPRPPVISRNGPKLWWEGTLVSSKKSYASIRAIPPAKIIRQQEAGLERKAGGASSWVLTRFCSDPYVKFCGFFEAPNFQTLNAPGRGPIYGFVCFGQLGVVFTKLHLQGLWPFVGL